MAITGADLSEGLELISHVSVRTYNEDYQTLLNKVSSGNCTLEDVAVVFDAAQTEQACKLPPTAEQSTGSDLAEGAAGRKNRSWLYYVAKAICKQAKKDPEFQKKLEEAAQAAQQSGHPVASSATVQNLTLISAASYIAHSVPGLGDLGTAGIAGILLIILSTGMDAFCSWVADAFGSKNEKSNS